MPLLLGSDIVFIPRIERALNRFGDRFLQRIYTERERRDCWRDRDDRHPPEREILKRLAGRWAAKEAIAKALGTGWTGIGYTDIEVRRLPSGAPSPWLHGPARDRSRHCLGAGPATWQLSISHDGDYAFAVAIALAEPAVPPGDRPAATAPLSTAEPSPIE